MEVSHLFINLSSTVSHSSNIYISYNYSLPIRKLVELKIKNDENYQADGSGIY